MKMEPIECSQTSAISTQTPGKYPKENTLHIKHGESLKSRKLKTLFPLSVHRDFQRLLDEFISYVFVNNVQNIIFLNTLHKSLSDKTLGFSKCQQIMTINMLHKTSFKLKYSEIHRLILILL